MEANKEKNLLEIYAQFLMVSTHQISNTVLSALLDHEISHDSFTRLLSHKEYTSSDLWRLSKKTVRSIEHQEAVLVIDDHIEEKQYMDENDLICWHYDHVFGRNVKGINQLSMLYHSQDYSIPVGFRFVLKTEIELDKKTNKEKRVSKISKNEHYRNLLQEAILHQVKFKYVLNDVWFCSAENIIFIHEQIKKLFIMPLKDNRKVALSKTDKLNGVYKKISELDLSDNKLVEAWLEGVQFPIHLTKQVFKNKDGSEGFIYLISNDLAITSTDIHTIYKKRWKVEEHHKTIKSNLNYGKSPAHTPRTQANHCFAVLYASIEWEKLSKGLGLNHFALKAKLYLNALKSAWNELIAFKNNSLRMNVA